MLEAKRLRVVKQVNNSTVTYSFIVKLEPEILSIYSGN